MRSLRGFVAVSDQETVDQAEVELPAGDDTQPVRKSRWSLWRLSIPIGAAALSLLVAVSMLLSPLLAFAVVAYLGAILLVVMFPVFLIPKLWRLSSESSYGEIRWAFRLHAARGAFLALTAAAFLLLPVPSASRPLFRVLVFAVPALFFGIPALGASVSFLLRHHPDASLFRRNPIVKRSRLLSEVTWVASGVLVGAVVWAFSLWPVSLRDGPDTAWSKSGFQSTFGVAPPSSVDNTYYRQFLFWQTNDVYVKFHYTDRAIVDQIIAGLELDPSEQQQTYHDIAQRFPERWLTEGVPASTLFSEFYLGRGQPAGGRSIWVDRDRQIVYYTAFY